MSDDDRKDDDPYDAEPAFPNPLSDPVKCPMPGCTEDLYVVLRFSTPIQVGSTVAHLADPKSACSQDWEVTCAGGHVVVLPADTAQDEYVFGADPAHQDASRLAETTGWTPPCVACRTPMFWQDCPTGGWWIHKTHPADGHDATTEAEPA